VATPPPPSPPIGGFGGASRVSAPKGKSNTPGQTSGGFRAPFRGRVNSSAWSCRECFISKRYNAAPRFPGFRVTPRARVNPGVYICRFATFRLHGWLGYRSVHGKEQRKTTWGARMSSTATLRLNPYSPRRLPLLSYSLLCSGDGWWWACRAIRIFTRDTPQPKDHHPSPEQRREQGEDDMGDTGVGA